MLNDADLKDLGFKMGDRRLIMDWIVNKQAQPSPMRSTLGTPGNEPVQSATPPSRGLSSRISGSASADATPCSSSYTTSSIRQPTEQSILPRRLTSAAPMSFKVPLFSTYTTFI